MTKPIPLLLKPLTPTTLNQLINEINAYVVATRADIVTADGISDSGGGPDDDSAYALLAGATFSGAISASNLSGTNTGDQSLAAYALTSSLGTAASLSVGTAANNIVQLNGSAQLPAIDGSLLTGISAGATNLNGLSDAIASYGAVNNMFLGNVSGANRTSGTNNTSLGGGALNAVTSGTYNVAVGDGALNSASTAGSNTAVGSGALTSAISGSNNVGIGTSALFSVTSGANNTAVGSGSSGSDTGGNNTTIGYNSGTTITSGSENTLIGATANSTGGGAVNQTALGYGATSPADNTVQIGNAAITDVYFGNNTAILHADGSALTNLPAGGATTLDGLTDVITNYTTHSMYLGTTSGSTVTAGTDNTSLGDGALQNVTLGAFNTAIGGGAIPASDIGSFNTAVGYRTGYGCYGYARDNTFIGYEAGMSNTSGCYNTIIGDAADVAGYPADSNQVVIGQAAQGRGYRTAQIGNTSITDVYFGTPATTVLHADGSQLVGIASTHVLTTTFDTANYLQLIIGGVTYKVCLAI
jgi:hypothetical protein